MIRLLIALAVYRWHRHVKKCLYTEAMKFQGKYTRIQCNSCGLHLWQAPGLFNRR